MVRFVIIGAVIAVAFTLYALVDAAMTEASRARGVSKPVWVVLVVVLPVIGAILWFTIGKGHADAHPDAARRAAPDNDPRFAGTRMDESELDEHMRELEERLRELDSETFPGEPGSRPDSARGQDEAPAQPPAPADETGRTQNLEQGGGRDGEPSSDRGDKQSGEPSSEQSADDDTAESK